MLSLNAQDFFAQRADLRHSFVSSHVAGFSSMTLLASDWASRRYFRVTKGAASYVLMEAVPDHTGAYTPGHKLSDYIRIARALKTRGIKTPEIFAADENNGYLLIEDFGDTTMAAACVKSPKDQQRFYQMAVDLLSRLRSDIGGNDLNLPLYADSHIHKGRQRLVDWYIPTIRRARIPDGLVQSYLAVWDDIEKKLPPRPMGFVHGDFHPQNLMVADGGLGLLDFQGAMWGACVYDLANLLEDIRRDVPSEIRDSMITAYGGDDSSRLWYRILATQFHCRLLGQAIRLAIAGNRPDFLAFIPRVQGYLMNALKDPILKPLDDWMKQERVDLTAQGCFDPQAVKPFIRGDAF